MAVPLAATEQPIETPFVAPLLARHEVLIEGEDVPTLDAYFTGDVAGAEVGLGYVQSRYETTHAAEADPDQPGVDDFFGPVAAKAAEDFFIGRQYNTAVKITFTWSDVSSFMWFEPIEESDLGDFEAGIGSDFFEAAGAVTPTDFFS